MPQKPCGIERQIATATPSNRPTTQRRLCSRPGVMRMGAAMMRNGFTAALSGLTLLLLGVVIGRSVVTTEVRSVGPAGKGGRVITVGPDPGVADLRGSLP